MKGALIPLITVFTALFLLSGSASSGYAADSTTTAATASSTASAASASKSSGSDSKASKKPLDNGPHSKPKPDIQATQAIQDRAIIQPRQ